MSHAGMRAGGSAECGAKPKRSMSRFQLRFVEIVKLMEENFLKLLIWVEFGWAG